MFRLRREMDRYGELPRALQLCTSERLFGNGQGLDRRQQAIGIYEKQVISGVSSTVVDLSISHAARNTSLRLNDCVAVATCDDLRGIAVRGRDRPTPAASKQLCAHNFVFFSFVA